MPGASLHQAIPVVVRDLVAEMTEQGAVGLAHLPPHALAFGIVGLGQVDGDEAVVVAGHHRLGRRAVGRRAVWRRSGQKIERQPVLGILQLGLQRQPKLEQRVEQPVLGELDLAPVRLVLGQRQIGDHPVVTAGGAKLLGAVHRNQPVAGAELRIGAIAVTALALGQRPQPALALFQSADRLGGRQIAKAAAAAFAADVLEIERLSAMLAFKKLHRWSTA